MKGTCDCSYILWALDENNLCQIHNGDTTYILPNDKVVGTEEISGHLFAIIDWVSLVETFPGKYIIFTNVKPVSDERLFLCTVLAICEDAVALQLESILIERGYKSTLLRTTNAHTGAPTL